MWPVRTPIDQRLTGAQDAWPAGIDATMIGEALVAPTAASHARAELRASVRTASDPAADHRVVVRPATDREVIARMATARSPGAPTATDRNKRGHTGSDRERSTGRIDHGYRPPGDRPYGEGSRA